MKKLLLLLAMLIAFAGVSFAQRTVTGNITDAKGESLVGASVIVKGTTLGTVTDLDGKFSLNVPANATSIVVSFAGYESKEMALGASNTIDASLSDALLGEIIVTGQSVGTDRRKMAADVQTVTSKNLPAVPTSSVDQALVGKIAGAQISSVNGTPGAKTSILLRGVNSFNSGTDPMYLIDGVQMAATDLNSIDPNSLSKIEVAQGAASTALYGAQGANGVIQGFTKQGKEGFHVDFSTSYTMSEYLNIGGVRKAALHGFNTNANNEVIDSKGTLLAVDPATGQYPQSLIWNSTDPSVLINKPYDKNLKYYDHFGLFFVKAPTSNVSLALSGAKGNIDYYIGASNNYSQSNLLNNGDYNRSNLTANLGIELVKGLKFRSISRLVSTKSTINDGGANGTIYAAFNTRPFVDYANLILPDGTRPAFIGGSTGVNGENPYFINEYSHTDNQKIDLLQSFNLNYIPTSWLELDAKYGINYQTQTAVTTYDRQLENANVSATGVGYGNNGNGAIYNNQNTVNFSNFLGGATVRWGLGDFLKASTYGAFDYRHFMLKNYNAYGLNLPVYTPVTTSQTAEQHATEYTAPFVTYGFVFDQKLDFGEFAGIGGGFRTDYSSAFGQGSAPFTFPHANGYLRIGELGFWKNSSIGKTIEEFKLRASYGKAGIQPGVFQRYLVLNTPQIGSSVGFSLPSTQSNPDLNVEVSTEYEVGTDIAVRLGKGNWFNNITFQSTYWTRKTDNAIGSKDLAPSSGIASVVDNLLGLESHGFQLVTRLQVAETRDFSWNFTANFGAQTSTVTKVAGSSIILTSSVGSTSYIIEPGSKIGQLFGYVGIHDVNAVDKFGVPYIADADKAKYEVASNGWVVDKARKAPFFSSQKYSFGDPNPSFILNFINGVTYKAFTLNLQVDWVQGSHLYNQTKEWMYRDGIHSDYETPITINGQTGAWSAFYRGVYAERSRNGTKSYFYEDASFVRLRNIELAVNVSKLFNIKLMRDLTVSFSGRNLLTFTKYTGLDPEVNSANVYGGGFASAWDRGTDHNTMPNLRQYTFGLRVGF
jgi:TonB-linked SusC/RagA family outer membrane protein